VDKPPKIAAGKSLKVTAEAGADGAVSLAADLVVLSLAHDHGDGQKQLADTLGAPLDDLGFYVSGNGLTSPFRTPAGGIFVCGFARGPVVAEEAYIEGVGAAGAVRSWLKR
jgi:heterodisulfide reductase subunit A-like polyferredoxin